MLLLSGVDQVESVLAFREASEVPHLSSAPPTSLTAAPRLPEFNTSLIQAESPAASDLPSLVRRAAHLDSRAWLLYDPARAFIIGTLRHPHNDTAILGVDLRPRLQK